MPQTQNMVKKNVWSIVVALIILYLSLTGTEKFRNISFVHIEGIDKIIHAGMYFVFMSVILFENRKRIYKRSSLLIIALIPLVFGAVLEILQSLLTTNRSGNIFDFLFNLAGILLSIVICLSFGLFKKTGVRL